MAFGLVPPDTSIPPMLLHTTSMNHAVMVYIHTCPAGAAQPAIRSPVVRAPLHVPCCISETPPWVRHSVPEGPQERETTSPSTRARTLGNVAEQASAGEWELLRNLRTGKDGRCSTAWPPPNHRDGFESPRERGCKVRACVWDRSTRRLRSALIAALKQIHGGARRVLVSAVLWMNARYVLHDRDGTGRYEQR